jgi:hypothetical protein
LTVLLWSQNVNVIRTHCIGDNIILCKSEIEQHYTINFLNKITSRCRNIKNLKWNITLSNASAAAVYFLTYTLTWIIIVSPARFIYVQCTYIQVYYSIYHNIFLSRKCSCRNSPTEFKSSLVPNDRYNFVCRNLKYIPLVARAGRLPVKRPRATKPLLCGRRTHACVNAYII